MREFMFKGPDRWEQCAEEAVRQKADGLEINQYYAFVDGIAVIFDRPKAKEDAAPPPPDHDLSANMSYNPYGPHGHKKNGHTLR